VAEWDGTIAYLRRDDVPLYCAHDHCGRVQNFESVDKTIRVFAGKTTNVFLLFRCRNCGITFKVFALQVRPSSEVTLKSGRATKIGEIPDFGMEPLGERFLSFLGSARDLFFKGRRAESRGMGIGAFAYYRRVVDIQRDKLFDAIVDVCGKLAVTGEVIDQLQAAKRESQFTKGVEGIKAALPDALYVDGKNPLTLLYRALSVGLHELSEEECLARAHAIRVVLAELLERVDRLVTQDKELKAAVAALLPKQ